MTTELNDNISKVYIKIKIDDVNNEKNTIKINMKYIVRRLGFNPTSKGKGKIELKKAA